MPEQPVVTNAEVEESEKESVVLEESEKESIVLEDIQDDQKSEPAADVVQIPPLNTKDLKNEAEARQTVMFTAQASRREDLDGEYEKILELTETET